MGGLQVASVYRCRYTCLHMFHYRLSLVWGRWDTAILCLFSAGWMGGGLAGWAAWVVVVGFVEGWAV